jgi:porphobilinogen synthase
MNLIHRPRRMRQNPEIRDIVAETHFSAEQFMLPVFVCEGKGVEKKHPQLSACLTLSLDKLTTKMKEAYDLGIKSCLLFGVSEKKDATASDAFRADAIMVKAIQEIREKIPGMQIATDIALDPYTDHGHDGLFENGKIVNDPTVERLCEMSLLHARAGAHILAPSDMMDGRVEAIRTTLDQENFEDHLILAYTAKYASALYGPFRDTLGAKPIGDKKSYQMDPRNIREALRELELDLSEGADMVMVKPATWYLDVIRAFAERSPVPVVAYHVSGECALLEQGAKAGLFDFERALFESMHSLFRAGSDLVATYYAIEIARILRK